MSAKKTEAWQQRPLLSAEGLGTLILRPGKHILDVKEPQKRIGPTAPNFIWFHSIELTCV